MSSTQRKLVLLIGILLAVVVVIAVVLSLGGSRGQTAASDVASPSATQVASPSGSAASESESPAVSAAPSGPVGGEALAILAEIEQQVEEIRGLEPADIGPPELISRADLRGELQRIFDAEYPPEEREKDNVALRALGLLEPDQDVAELQLELLGEGVLGFYDDTQKRMVVVTDAGLDAAAKVTYAHEYTHALQDAAFGLDSLQTDAIGEDDRGLARTALIEGDATVTMIAWLFEHLSNEEQMELGSMPIPDTSGIPAWMVAQLEFPYAAGQFWVSQLAGGDPFAPAYAAINSAFADAPTSTEQIIDINRWYDREEPLPVEVPDLAAALGEGWVEVDETPIGQASITIMLEHFGVVASDAGLAADGWGGDRAIVASGPDDAFALAWRLEWDEPGDAAEFTSAYATVVQSLAFPASVQELPGGGVLVVHASSQELHDATVEVAGG